MPNHPRVSIILPVYNAAETIRLAVDSIFRQTFRDFELIVVNDGSTDATDLRLRDIHDPRMRVVSQPNSGLVAALNNGIAQSTGAYIARLDADDEWDDPDKLRQQVTYLDQHPECVVVGTYFTTVTPDGKRQSICPPLEDNDLRRVLLKDATLAHPTVVFRRQTFEAVGGYRLTHGQHVEDLDLWFRMGQRGTFHVVPVFGLLYSLSPSGISRRHYRQQMINTFRLITANLFNRSFPGLWPSWFKYLVRSVRAVVGGLV